MARVTGSKLDAAVARCARRGLPAAPSCVQTPRWPSGRTIYGKPDDARHAQRMLAWQLAGQTHQVLTAVAVQGWVLAQVRNGCRERFRCRK